MSCATSPQGNMVIVTDDADRENEGDLVMAAEKVTRGSGQFHGQARPRADLRAGFEQRAEQLGLQRMVAQNREMYRDGFHRFSRCGARSHHRNQRARPRRDDPDDRESKIDRRTIWCSRGMCFRCGRRTAACCGARATPKQPSILPRMAGLAAGRRPLRNPARRRHDGAPSGADGVQEKARPPHLHDSKSDRPSAR